jgi:hypothetical protein
LDPGVFYTYFYTHARRLRLKKLLDLELSIEVLTDFLNHSWIQVAVSLLKPPHGTWPFPNGHNYPFGCSGYVTAVAAGQSQLFYSGVGIFSWRYLSLPPQILLLLRVHLE